MEPDIRACEVCRTVTQVYVASSALGAISHASCERCAIEGYEPWSTIVGGLWGAVNGPNLDNLHESVRPNVERMLTFHKKTVEDLWREIQELDRSYDEYMAAEAERQAAEDSGGFSPGPLD